MNNKNTCIFIDGKEVVGFNPLTQINLNYFPHGSVRCLLSIENYHDFCCSSEHVASRNTHLSAKKNGQPISGRQNREKNNGSVSLTF